MLPGRGTLIPMQVFFEIGLFDSKNFPQYAADEDFSLNARKNGWKLLVPTGTYLMSHIEAMGTDINSARFSLKYYRNLFFSIKSPINLKIRYRWAMKNSPLKFFYFILDCIRIGVSVSFISLKNSLHFFPKTNLRSQMRFEGSKVEKREIV
jgi:GT2 family glycosyltransferase